MSHIHVHWRDLAQQARVLAQKIADQESKRIFLEIAEAYDRLAEIAKRTSIH